MNVMSECEDVKMWRCENESRICGLRGFRGSSSLKLINNVSFFFAGNNQYSIMIFNWKIREIRLNPRIRYSRLLQKRIILLLKSNSCRFTMARVNNDIVRQYKQFFPDTFDKRIKISSGQIGSPNA